MRLLKILGSGDGGCLSPSLRISPRPRRRALIASGCSVSNLGTSRLSPPITSALSGVKMFRSGRRQASSASRTIHSRHGGFSGACRSRLPMTRPISNLSRSPGTHWSSSFTRRTRSRRSPSPKPRRIYGGTITTGAASRAARADPVFLSRPTQRAQWRRVLAADASCSQAARPRVEHPRAGPHRHRRATRREVPSGFASSGYSRRAQAERSRCSLSTPFGQAGRRSSPAPTAAPPPLPDREEERSSHRPGISWSSRSAARTGVDPRQRRDTAERNALMRIPLPHAVSLFLAHCSSSDLSALSMLLLTAFLRSTLEREIIAGVGPRPVPVRARRPQGSQRRTSI